LRQHEARLPEEVGNTQICRYEVSIASTAADPLQNLGCALQVFTVVNQRVCAVDSKSDRRLCADTATRARNQSRQSIEINLYDETSDYAQDPGHESA